MCTVKVEHALHWTRVLQATFPGKVRVCFSGSTSTGDQASGLDRSLISSFLRPLQMRNAFSNADAGCRRIQMDAFCLKCVNGLLAGCFALQSICPLSAPSSDSSDMAERLGRRSLKKMPGQMGEMQRKESANPRLLQRGARQRRNEQEQARHEKSQELLCFE